MGYNGGINKRGYYRRYHGMYRKSSYRSGEKILSGLIIGGLKLIFTAASSTLIPKVHQFVKERQSINKMLILHHLSLCI